MENKIARTSQELYGCSVPFHPPTYSENGNKEIEICNNITAGMNAHDHYMSYLGSVVSSKDKPCAIFDINVGLPDIDDEGNDMKEAYVRLYLKTEIKVKSIVIYYDSTTFAAEVGGYVGMIIGVSIVDLAILFNAGALKIIYKMLN